MKTMLSVTAIVTALGCASAFAESAPTKNPYGVQPHEVRVLNKEPSAADIANICINKAKYKGLAGDAMNQFVDQCKSDA